MATAEIKQTQTQTLGGTPEGRIQRYFCVDDDGCHAFERLSRDAEVVSREPKLVQVDGKEVSGWIVEILVAATDGVVRFDPLVENQEQ